jgi:biopolymer transport protein ExbB
MILGRSIIDLFKSSVVMLALLAASIATVALVIERLWYFNRNRFNQTKALTELRRMLGSRASISEALNWARAQKNPLGRLFTVAMENVTLPADELSDLVYSLILEERLKYERLLGGLGTLANVATLLGLLGTVTGLITAFQNIAVTGSGGPAVVSAGIAEALVTTAFGLFIGIPALFFYNYFAKKAADMTVVLESVSDRLMIMLNRYKDKREVVAAPAEPPPQPARPKPASTNTEETGWKF